MKEKITITKKNEQTSAYLYTYYPQYMYINLNFEKINNFNHRTTKLPLEYKKYL